MEKSKFCIHRHTIETHPNCFTKLWYKQKGEKLAYLDIETSGLDADNDWLLSWSLKPYKENKVSFDYITFEDIFLEPGKVDRKFDKFIVESLLKEMDKYTGFCTYYGTGFDIKFIRSKAMQYGLKFPKYGEKKHIDLYYQVAGKMKLSHSSLKTSTKFLDIKGKTELAFRYWKLACLGDRVALSELVEHNKQDVIILERLHKELEPYGRFDRKSL